MIVFQKQLVKTTTKEAFLSIFTLYCDGRNCCSRSLDIAKLDKILDREINFKTLY